MQDSEIFSRIMEEHGNSEHVEKDKEEEEEDVKDLGVKADLPEKKGELMQEEERNTGSVAWVTYRDYLRFAGGVILGPIFLTLLILNQVASGGDSLVRVLSSTDWFNSGQ